MAVNEEIAAIHACKACGSVLHASSEHPDLVAEIIDRNAISAASFGRREASNAYVREAAEIRAGIEARLREL